MRAMVRWLCTAALAAICVAAGAGCAAGDGDVLTPSPVVATVTPLPSATATPKPIATATPWPTPTVTPTPVPGVLYVDAGRSLGPISPLVYGTNVGPWQSVTSRMEPFIIDAGFTFLRFPGGNWGDEYSLGRDQLDDFVATARELSAVPMVNVKFFRAKAEDAAGWVEYANLTQGYAIRYWGIGNEPSLYASNRELEGYDAATFNAEWREFALAMKAVDPEILLVGPEIHQYTGDWESPRDAHGRDWMTAFLEANGDLVDVVSFHRYPFGTYEPRIPELRTNPREWDTIVPALRAQIREITGRELPIAVTEVNSNWSHQKGGEATPDSLYNAIWWADVLGRMVEQRVEIVAHFALEGGGGVGLMAYPTPRPTYYVYPLYRRFGSELIYAASDDPEVRIYAARRDDGALTLVVVNLGAREAVKPLQLAGFAPEAPAEVWRLDADHLAEVLEPVPFDDVTELRLPGASVTLYVLER